MAAVEEVVVVVLARREKATSSRLVGKRKDDLPVLIVVPLITLLLRVKSHAKDKATKVTYLGIVIPTNSKEKAETGKSTSPRVTPLLPLVVHQMLGKKESQPLLGGF